MDNKLHDFIKKYCEAMEFYGTPINGLKRAELYAAMKESGFEEMLDMLDAIKRYEDMQVNVDFNRASPQPPVGNGTDYRFYSNGTTWDATKVTTTGGHTPNVMKLVK